MAGRPEQAISEVSSLGDLLLRQALVAPLADALVLPGEKRSYGALAQAAQGWAKLFIARGVGPGDHIGLLLPNCMAFMEALFGAMIAGAVIVPINARYRGAEIAYVAENADLVAIVTVGAVTDGLNLLERLGEAFDDFAVAADGAIHVAAAPKLHSLIVLDGARFGTVDAKDAIADAAAVPDAALDARRAQVKLRDTCVILYTSGTTSAPKGCMLSHEAIYRQGCAMAERYGLTGADRLWCPLPMYHVGGISPVVAMFSVGGAFVSMHRFEPGLALRQHGEERITMCYILFGAFIADMLYHPDAPVADLSRVRLMVSNLSVLSEKLAAELRAFVPHTIQLGTFGMTETVGCALTHAPDDDATERATRLGKALPGIEAKILRDDGTTAAPLETGEILIRGATLFSGYYKDPEKTAQALRRGWYHTGDRGSLSAEGSIAFAGRIKDMLKVGGENVAAQEIEQFIGRHPAVKLCFVVGVPHPRLDEAPAAFIELKPGMTTTEAEIIAFCKGKIASFKTPHHVRFVEDWPMSSSKVQKFKLREMIVG